MTVIARLHFLAAEQHLPYPVFSVFEDGDEYKGELIDSANNVPEELRPIFRGNSSCHSKQRILQRGFCRNVTLKIQRATEVDIWGKSYKRLHEVPNDYQIWGEKELLDLCADLKSPHRK
jgi:hypothetical protein